ncbi:pantetheine-phosphate adenylyltransferase [Tepidimonas aquatica]|uniref:Phosphopantetheine adenylyltransferase n=1 Tax=Tepidimonas aquatica TaxID=247482 RepID=A0A554WWK6_9BURK|nr:pantetheine-phosphate adenylyltransferase [Tepidimonas aquatica]TSE27962.1 Phosphopantetheine adenylyltransferase [Tepidimonas aquatica]
MNAATPNPRVAVTSGTFDPITLGHEDVIRRAAERFERLIVAVAIAHHKKTLLSLDERLSLAREVLRDCPNVQVLPVDGLIMDFCRQQGAATVVRGIRNVTDFDYEAQMAAMNAKLAPEVHTVFLLPQPALQCISGTLVREIARLGGDVSQMVSPVVAERLRQACART